MAANIGLPNTTLKGTAMSNETFTSTVVVVAPGNHVATYVVEQSETGTQIAAHLDESLPPAAPALILLQLCASLVPAGHAGFHLWRAEAALKAEFAEVNTQMANVPAMSEDELPF